MLGCVEGDGVAFSVVHAIPAVSSGVAYRPPSADAGGRGWSSYGPLGWPPSLLIVTGE